MSETQVTTEHLEAIAGAIQEGVVPSTLTPALVQAVKAGLSAALDSFGTNVRSLDFGSATPVIAMLAPTVIAAAKAWIINFQYPKPVVPPAPQPYPPQPGPYPYPQPPVPVPPQPPPQPYYPPQPTPYPPQPQPQPQPYYPPTPPQPAPYPPQPKPPRNGVDINVK